MDVVVDDVPRRRGDIPGRPDPCGHRRVIRHRQDVRIGRRRWRRRVDIIDRAARQVSHRRRWRRGKPEIGIGVHQHRTLDIDDLGRRRRRHVVPDVREPRRRLEIRRQRGKPATRIVGVSAARVTFQVRPVRWRRVYVARPAPGDSLAAGRHDRAHALRHRIVGIGVEEGLVVRQGVAIDGGEICFLRAKITQRPRPERGGLFAGHLGRRRIGRPLEEIERRLQLRRIPRHLRALRRLVDAQPDAAEKILRLQPAFAHHLGERPGIGRIRPGLVGRHGAWRRVEGDQHALLGLDERQPAGKRGAGLGERIGPRDIEDHHGRLQFQRGERHGVIRQAEGFGRDVHVAGDPGIDRREIILSLELQPVAAEIDERDGLGSGGRCLAEKLPEGPPHRILIEIARPADIEAGGLERLRDEAGIVRRGRQGARLIVGIADDQRDALLRLLGPGFRPDDQDAGQQGGNELQRRHHSRPAELGTRSVP